MAAATLVVMFPKDSWNVVCVSFFNGCTIMWLIGFHIFYGGCPLLGGSVIGGSTVCYVSMPMVMLDYVCAKFHDHTYVVLYAHSKGIR